jgi:hypothetical protein
VPKPRLRMILKKANGAEYFETRLQPDIHLRQAAQASQKEEAQEVIALTSWLHRLWLFVMPKHDDECAHEISEELRHLRHEIKELKESIVIAQATLDASLTGLTSAVNAAAAALATSNTATSTPDTVVNGFLSGVKRPSRGSRCGHSPCGYAPGPGAINLLRQSFLTPRSRHRGVFILTPGEVSESFSGTDPQ